MIKRIQLAILLASLFYGHNSLAWDGFDSESSDLVEIIPDRYPVQGETVDVRNYDKNDIQTCLVEIVTRNARTVEVVVRSPDGTRHTLVMEGR